MNKKNVGIIIGIILLIIIGIGVFVFSLNKEEDKIPDGEVFAEEYNEVD